jgi:hypothetical protein
VNILESSGLGLVGLALLSVQAFSQTPEQLSTEDRGEIQALSASYAEALSACRAEDYAALFVPGSGYFASGFRGHISGQANLIELVRSERHCLAPDGPAAARPGGRSGPTVEIEIDGGHIFGVADLGTAEYQDEYTRTTAGWRFASRTVIVANEKAAGLDAAGLLAIHRLGGRELGSLYETDENGVKRLLTSGVRVSIEGETVAGRAFLNDGAYRDEVYELVAPGEWRIESSAYMPPGR